MNENLGIAAELAANRAKYARYAYVAPQDRKVPVSPAALPAKIEPAVPVSPAPLPAKIEPAVAVVEDPAPPPCPVVRVTYPHIRSRGIDWRTTVRSGTHERIGDVLAMTAQVFGVTVEELISARRAQSVAHARFAAMHVMNKILRLSLPSIGGVLNRDHTSCMYAVRRAAKLRKIDRSFASRSQHLARELRSLWSVK